MEANYDIIPIEDIKRVHTGYWFSEGAKGFFNSRWDSYALRNKGSIFAYFISSEKCRDDDARKYTIRSINMLNGEFSTPATASKELFDFQRFSTKKQADKALRAYLIMENILEDHAAWIEQEIKHIEIYVIPQQVEKVKKLQSKLEELKRTIEAEKQEAEIENLERLTGEN